NPHGMAGGGHTLAVEPDKPARCQGGGCAARANKVHLSEPLVDTLPIQILADGAQVCSLLPCSSCCLSAASLANGELGSGCLSRRWEPCGFAKYWSRSARPIPSPRSRRGPRRALRS